MTTAKKLINTSDNPTITLKKDLFEKNTTLTLTYSQNIDQVYGDKEWMHQGWSIPDRYRIVDIHNQFRYAVTVCYKLVCRIDQSNFCCSL